FLWQMGATPAQAPQSRQPEKEGLLARPILEFPIEEKIRRKPDRNFVCMPKFAANLSFMFNEWDFLDRFNAAADAGFRSVEYLFPYDHAPEVIAARLRQNNLE